MAAKKAKPKIKGKVIERGNPHLIGAGKVEVEIPDEVITYIVSRYLRRRSTDGVPLVVGISSDDVETVLALFIEWAASKGYIKDGVLFLGGTPIG